MTTDWPAYASLATVAPAGQSAASYTTSRDTTAVENRSSRFSDLTIPTARTDRERADGNILEPTASVRGNQLIPVEAGGADAADVKSGTLSEDDAAGGGGLEHARMKAAEIVHWARVAGIRVKVDADELVLEAAAPPASDLIDMLAQNKPAVIAYLKQAVGGWSAEDW